MTNSIKQTLERNLFFFLLYLKIIFRLLCGVIIKMESVKKVLRYFTYSIGLVIFIH